jgi:hypothetical protein
VPGPEGGRQALAGRSSREWQSDDDWRAYAEDLSSLRFLYEEVRLTASAPVLVAAEAIHDGLVKLTDSADQRRDVEGGDFMTAHRSRTAALTDAARKELGVEA